MGIPLKYNLRNLTERKATTFMTAAGIALTVGVLVAAMALMEGLRTVFAATGNPLQTIVMRTGGTAELNSAITDAAYQEIKLMEGIAKTSDGAPMASPELVSVINLPSIDNPKGMNVTVRGLTPVGISMRSLKLQAGRWFTPGKRELVVGRSTATRYQSASLGSKIRFGRGEWEVVGVFTGGQSAVNSEIWCDLDELAPDVDRQGNISSVLVRMQSTGQIEPFLKGIEDNPRLKSSAQKEQDYYASMTVAGDPIKFLGIFVAVIMAIGSAFGAMNTMYAAVARRSREIGTLRSLGFSRSSILLSFMFESIVLSLLGGIIGCLLILPLNGMSTAIGSFKSFSEVAFSFRVSALAICLGLTFAAVIGALGGFFPALAASRRDLLTTLREA